MGLKRMDLEEEIDPSDRFGAKMFAILAVGANLTFGVIRQAENPLISSDF